MRNGPEKLFEGVVVSGGERTELSHEFVSAVLSIGARRGDDLVDAVVSVVDGSGNRIRGGRTYTSPSSNPKRLLVAPGNYTVRISEIRGERREVEIDVRAGETAEMMIDLDQP